MKKLFGERMQGARVAFCVSMMAVLILVSSITVKAGSVTNSGYYLSTYYVYTLNNYGYIENGILKGYASSTIDVSDDQQSSDNIHVSIRINISRVGYNTPYSKYASGFGSCSNTTASVEQPLTAEGRYSIEGSYVTHYYLNYYASEAK